MLIPVTQFCDFDKIEKLSSQFQSKLVTFACFNWKLRWAMLLQLKLFHLCYLLLLESYFMLRFNELVVFTSFARFS